MIFQEKVSACCFTDSSVRYIVIGLYSVPSIKSNVSFQDTVDRLDTGRFPGGPLADIK